MSGEGLARVENVSPSTLAELDQLGRSGGDAAHALEEIEHRPLRTEEGAVAATDPDQVLPPGNAISVRYQRLEVHLFLQVSSRLYQPTSHLDTGDDAVRLSGDKCSLQILPRDDREGGEVVRDPILVEGEVDETI